MSNNKAIIFDMDGVLVDSEKFWAQAENEVFTSLGVQLSNEYTEITKAMTTLEVTQFWYEKYPWRNVALEEVEQMVISRVIELIELENCHIEGVKPFVEKLRKENYKIGLATNSPDRIIPIVLKKLDVLHLFDTAVSAEFEIKGKPDAAVYLRAAKKLNILPQNCIAIEDSNSGMVAAKSAGMKVVAFTNGNDEIHFEMADYRISSFENAEAEHVAHLF
ncbi:2-deoxyglucose-6-phosphatase [Marivirga lumbricoides]|uniref:2-deoxyglucose-6-phosphatase n=1 Tax=Marivirga lumbricoides TaxID=1046115 RepID=A0ABQ1LQG2_9BACT|nr:2-deoxyglucose-6-phosphatase [Marivirga lumbricoides]